MAAALVPKAKIRPVKMTDLPPGNVYVQLFSNVLQSRRQQSRLTSIMADNKIDLRAELDFEERMAHEILETIDIQERLGLRFTLSRGDDGLDTNRIVSITPDSATAYKCFNISQRTTARLLCSMLTPFCLSFLRFSTPCEMVASSPSSTALS